MPTATKTQRRLTKGLFTLLVASDHQLNDLRDGYLRSMAYQTAFAIS